MNFRLYSHFTDFLRLTEFGDSGDRWARKYEELTGCLPTERTSVKGNETGGRNDVRERTSWWTGRLSVLEHVGGLGGS